MREEAKRRRGSVEVHGASIKSEKGRGFMVEVDEAPMEITGQRSAKVKALIVEKWDRWG